MTTRRKLLAGTAGMGVLGWAYTSLSSGSESSSDETSSTAGLVVSSSGPSCLEELDDEYSGWIHVSPSEVSFDVIVEQTQDRSIDPTITHDGNGRYEITIAETAAQDPAPSDGSCPTGTRIKAVSALPTEYEHIQFRLEEEPLETIEREGDFPTHRQLEPPLEI